MQLYCADDEINEKKITLKFEICIKIIRIGVRTLAVPNNRAPLFHRDGRSKL